MSKTILAIGAHIGDMELTAGALLASCAVSGGHAVTLALTEDEGETFPCMRSIETGENFLGDGQQCLNRQYHYPSIIQSRDGRIHVSYSFHGRDCIFYHQISEDWITGSAERT